MLKPLSNLGLQEHISTVVILTSNIILNGKKLEGFQLRHRTRQGCPLSTLLCNLVLELLPKPLGKKNKSEGYKWERTESNYAPLQIIRSYVQVFLKISLRDYQNTVFGKVVGFKTNT